MAHKMHNMKYKSPIRENPQKEVLQPYIRLEIALQCYFIGMETAVDYTLDLEKICA